MSMLGITFPTEGDGVCWRPSLKFLRQGAMNVAQLVKCLASMHETLGLIYTLNKPGVVVHPCNLRRQRQEDYEFEVMFSYIVIYRPAWDT